MYTEHGICGIHHDHHFDQKKLCLKFSVFLKPTLPLRMLNNGWSTDFMFLNYLHHSCIFLRNLKPIG